MTAPSLRYYPVNLDVRDRPCLVVGGGAVATRKVRGLLNCGAAVTVVSPVVSDLLRELAETGTIVWHDRGYETADLDGVFLVFSATDNRAVNRQVRDDARQTNILCNIADLPDACNFTLPAVVSRGDLVISVSTSGKSPALSRLLRKRLEEMFGTEYAEGLRLMGAIRERLLAAGHDPEAHKRGFRAVLEDGLMGMIRDRNIGAIDRLLLEIFGPGHTFTSLMKAASDSQED